RHPGKRNGRGERGGAHGHWRDIGRWWKTLTQPHREPRTHRRGGRVLSQARDDAERRGVWLGPWIDPRKRARHRQWCPEAHAFLAGQICVRLRDTDDLETLTPEQDSLADDRWIRAVAGPPRLVREHDDRHPAASGRVIRSQQSPDGRPRP